MRRRLPILLVAFLAIPLAGMDCATEDEVEHWRRTTEGGLDTPGKLALALANIASLEDEMGGAVAGSLAERMAAYQAPGVQVAVVNGGVVEWTEAWGVGNTLTGEPLARHRRLQAASISKPATALAILQLVQAGVLDLDTPVNGSLTSWSIPDNAFTTAEPVTLRHVLSHTSGMNNESFIGYPVTAAIPTLLQILDGLAPASTPPFEIVQQPGTDWMYSGGAYTVLAQLIEDVTGEDFDAWMTQHVLWPAGMWRSTFEQPLSDPGAHDAGVGTIFGSPVGAFVYPERPAAGLWSTALDLGRMVVAIQRSLAGESGALLDAVTSAGLVTPQSPGPTPFEIGFSPDPRMGLGLFLSDGGSPQWFWHTGGNVGFNCILVGSANGQGFGAAVMTNAFPGGRLLAWEIINAIADLYGWPGWDDWGV